MEENKKLDFRIQRTYKLLMDALFTMMQEKNFDEISVSELCERAMIRRATFYKHFGDKYELFAFAIRELKKQTESERSAEYDHKHPGNIYAKIIDCSLQFVEENWAISKSIAQSGSSHILTDILFRETETDIRRYLREEEKQGAVLPIEPDLFATMFAGASVYTTRWWLMQEEPLPREKLTEAFVSLIKFM